MDWIKQLNQAINYIENNLDGDISYQEVAKIACCSVYNFQRMFSYVADRTLADYIRSRRLTLAAFDVLNTHDKIIDIATKYGYESQDAFTRAFKAFHGSLPSKVRSEVVQLKSCPKLSFQIIIKGENHMNYQIEQWPAFTLAGIKQRINIEHAFEIVPGIWENAWKDGTMNRLLELCQRADCRPAGIVGLAGGGQCGDSEEMDYFIGATIHVDVEGCKQIPVPDGMELVTIRASTWGIFEANGELPNAVQDIYKPFYSEWLPNSGYAVDDLPSIECYMQDNKQEVWLPLKKD